MPRFGGFQTNTGGLVNGLITNALGGNVNSVTAQGNFGSSALQGAISLLGQSRINQDAANRRVSLRPKPAGANRVLGSGLLNPLRETNNGLVWPYTPSISYQHNVTYDSIPIVHANQDFHIYSRTPAVELQVAGQFTVQNQKEGAYALATLHFLRTVSKMNFGETDPNAGTPPPVLLFNAYGPFVFNNVPVIVKGFSMEFPEEVHYVGVSAQGVGLGANTGIVAENLPPLPGQIETWTGPSGESLSRVQGGPSDTGYNTVTPRSSANRATNNQGYNVWLPSLFKLTVNLVVQHTPEELRKRFNLPSYINGSPNQSDFV